jgi:DNA repair photolyase
MKTVKIRKIFCRQALSPSKIHGFSYSLNPYTGCQHGCIYCYARFMCKYRKGNVDKKEEWGTFVDVKVNIPDVLNREIGNKQTGRIMFCSVTDGYQQIEKKYELSRKCMEIFSRYNFPVSILTKSCLVERDMDMISRMKGIEVGMTITFSDDRDRRIFEPDASPTEDRLKTLKKFSETGISTYAFFGPFIPGASDKELQDFVRKIADTGISSMLLDRFGIKYGNWEPMQDVLRKNYPEVFAKHRELFLKQSDYYRELKIRMQELCKANGLKLEVIFR